MANSDSSTTPTNDANQTVTGGSTGSSPPREKEADGIASDIAETQDAEREPTQKSSGIAAKPLRLKSGLNVTLTFVRYGQIAGLDEECSNLMLEMDELVETSGQFERWDAELLECTSYSQIVILWRKSKKLVHIGSGRILNVLNRISKFDSLIPAFVIENAKLDRTVKLRCILAEMAVLPSIGRHQNANYEALIRLLRFGDAAGIKIVKTPKGGHKERSISYATAISYNTVHAYWNKSSVAAGGDTES